VILAIMSIEDGVRSVKLDSLVLLSYDKLSSAYPNQLGPSVTTPQNLLYFCRFGSHSKHIVQLCILDFLRHGSCRFLGYEYLVVVYIVLVVENDIGFRLLCFVFVR
jgi:hypothetical protein